MRKWPNAYSGLPSGGPGFISTSKTGGKYCLAAQNQLILTQDNQAVHANSGLVERTPHISCSGPASSSTDYRRFLNFLRPGFDCSLDYVNILLRRNKVKDRRSQHAKI